MYVLKISVRNEFRYFIEDPDVYLELQESRMLPSRQEGHYYLFDLDENCTHATIHISHPGYTTRVISAKITSQPIQEITVYMGKAGSLFYWEEDTKVFFTPFPHRLAILFKPQTQLGFMHRSGTEQWLRDFDLQWDDHFYTEADTVLNNAGEWHAVVVCKKDNTPFNQDESNELYALRNHQSVTDAGPLLGYRGLFTNNIIVEWNGPDPGEAIQLLENKGLHIKMQAHEIYAGASKGIGLKIVDIANELYDTATCIRRVSVQQQPLFTEDDRH